MSAEERLDGVTLITGVGGFIGRVVARRLRAAGHAVVGLDAAAPAQETDVPWRVADLRDAARVEAILAEHRPRRVLHAGGISGPMLVLDDPRLVFEVNATGTLNVLEAARLHGSPRVVFLSSFVAYGDQPDDGPVSEERALLASDAYGASKAAAEAMARVYRAQHGLETVSLRLGAVYGPGRTTRCFVRTLLARALAGRETRFDFGAGWHRSYVHVDDVADAVEAALALPFERIGEHAYNVGGGIWPTLDEVAEVARAVAPHVRAALAPGRVPHDYRVGPLDLRAAQRDLGYRPRVALADGIARYHAWLAAGGGAERAAEGV